MNTTNLSPMESVTLTPAAIAHIKKCLKKRGSGKGLRIKIKTTGCSGLAYKLEYVDEAAEGDSVFTIDDELAIYIDPKSLTYIKGSTLDYVKRGLNEGLEFVNPNEKGRCGCGESFNV